MRQDFVFAPARDDPQMREFARRLNAWEPEMEIRYARTTELQHRFRTQYALLMSGEARLYHNEIERTMTAGDLAVIGPGVEVWLEDEAEFLVLATDDRPRHYTSDFLHHDGFEVFLCDPTAPYRSECGFRKEVLPATDLRYRLQYHFVEIDRPAVHKHDDMVELYYVLYGAGTVSVGAERDRLSALTVKSGDVLAVGPGLYHPASDGLGMCIFFLFHRLAHERRCADWQAHLNVGIVMRS